MDLELDAQRFLQRGEPLEEVAGPEWLPGLLAQDHLAEDQVEYGLGVFPQRGILREIGLYRHSLTLPPAPALVILEPREPAAISHRPTRSRPIPALAPPDRRPGPTSYAGPPGCRLVRPRPPPSRDSWPAD